MASGPNRHSTLLWRKSSMSGGNSECVEVAVAESFVLVRDSRDQPGTRLTFGPDQWRTFVRQIRAGRIPPG
jgi:hypothetical protein